MDSWFSRIHLGDYGCNYLGAKARKTERLSMMPKGDRGNQQAELGELREIQSDFQKLKMLSWKYKDFGS